MDEKNKSLAQSFRHAFEGLRESIKAERNMKIHLTMTILVVVCSVVFGLSAVEKVIAYAMCGAVMSAELLNTAVENAVDICAPTFNMYAKRAKDAAAAAVLVISIAAAVVGTIIFLPYGIRLVVAIQRAI